jgi:ankyrin repeat protein
MYSSDAILALLVQAYPQACSHANSSARLPLHLLCARCWDQNVISVDTLKLVVEKNPSALKTADRRGRMPLHVACASDPRGDVLNVLVPLHPEALLITDKSKLTPFEMAKKFSASHDSNVVLAFLQDRTNRERRKKYKFLAPFKHVSYKLTASKPASARRGKPDIDALNLHYCYG